MSISLLCLASNAIAANSPEQFSEQFIKALNERNDSAYAALLLPQSKQHELAKGQEKFAKKLTILLSQKSPAEYAEHKVVITDISQDKDYNFQDNTVTVFGSKVASFPIRLQKRLTVYVKEGQRDKAGEWTLPITTQVLAEYDGQWYMVWPERIQ